MKVTLKNIKVCQFASQETLCFEATVYIDGKKAGHVSNDGHGGSNIYYIEKAKRDAFHAYCESLPSTYGIEGHPNADADELIGRLLDEHEANKQMKTWCRKKVMFRLNGDKDGEWRSIGFKNIKKMTPELLVKAKAHLTAKHGDNIEEILNDRFAA